MGKARLAQSKKQINKKMKKWIFIFCIWIANVAFAEKIVLQSVARAGVKVHQTSENTRVYSNVIAEIDVENRTYQGQNFSALNLDGYVHHGAVGHPQLPAKTQLLSVPPGANVEVKILSSEYTDIPLAEKGFVNPIFPVQPRMRKSEEKEPVFVQEKSAYQRASFNTDALVDVKNLGIAKDKQWAQLNIRPIQYLPSQNVIRVYYSIDFEIITQDGAFFAKTETEDTAKPLVYQLISDRKFENSLTPFIEWKTEKGFDVRIAYTDQAEVGKTRDSLYAYLKSIYESSEPADYLVFVGDVEEIPPFTTRIADGHPLLEDADRHVTDLYYAEYTGDYLPDVYYGRLSANTPEQLAHQIEKILAMEKLDIPKTDFLKKSMLIAGYDSDSDWRAVVNATVTYGSTYYFNEANGIESTILRSPDSRNKGGVVQSYISDGAGFVNYTAHCDWNEWSSPQVTIGMVNNLQNENKYPFIIGNCCLSNKFEKKECFGEALVRGEKKGAVTYIGGTNYTYWYEDFAWSVGSVSDLNVPGSITYENSGFGVFDRIFHTHGEPRSDWASTAGEILFAGNMSVQLSTANSEDMGTSDEISRYYWEIYHILGDPSYVPYFTDPKPVSANNPTRLDDKTFDVMVNNGQLHARIYAEKPGKATIRLFNLLGQPVSMIASNGNVNTGHNNFYCNLSNLPQGIYVCVYFDGIQSRTRKIMKP